MIKKSTSLLLLFFVSLNIQNITYSMENPSLYDEGIAGWLQFVALVNLASAPTTYRSIAQQPNEQSAHATSKQSTTLTILATPRLQSTHNTLLHGILKKRDRPRINAPKIKTGRRGRLPKKISFEEARDPDYKKY